MTLAKLPDVLTVTKAEEDLETVAADICQVLDKALAAYNTMRAVEGRRLAEDIAGRLVTIETAVGRVERQSPQTVSAYRERLEKKMREVLEMCIRDREQGPHRGGHQHHSGDRAAEDVYKRQTLDAAVSSELLKNIFFVKAPMHDGAVIIRQGRILGAGCMLPLSKNVNLLSLIHISSYTACPCPGCGRSGKCGRSGTASQPTH